MSGSSSEDDLLDSLGGGGPVLLGAWLPPLPPDGLDLLPGVGVLVRTEDLANAGEGVLSLRAFLPLLTIGCHLAVARSHGFTLVCLGILIFMGGVFLIVGEFGFAA